MLCHLKFSTSLLTKFTSLVPKANFCYLSLSHMKLSTYTKHRSITISLIFAIQLCTICDVWKACLFFFFLLNTKYFNTHSEVFKETYNDILYYVVYARVDAKGKTQNRNTENMRITWFSLIGLHLWKNPLSATMNPNMSIYRRLNPRLLI